MTLKTIQSQEAPQVERLDVDNLPVTEARQFQHAFGLANVFRSRDGRKSLLAIFSNYAVIGLCLVLSEQDWPSSYSSAIGWCVYATACIVISSRLRAFEVLVHEASHFNLFKSPSMHYNLQFLYAFPVFRDLEDYRRSHLIHHQHLGDPTKDPDLVRIVELGLDNMSDDPVFYLFALPFSGFIHWEYLSTVFVDFWTLPSARTSKVAYWAAVVAGMYFHQGFARIIGLYHLVPLFVILPVTRYWSEASEHLGLNMTGKFGNSRSNIGFSQLWFSHPHNDGYHAVHHLHSQVPFHQLPQAHEVLMNESEAFRSDSVVSTGLLEMFRQMASKRTVFKKVAIQL
ncbi:fatty acid desaturase-domain-containing protein [Astrocystis sublimbata]|nr:fatty acid desaturase-domain-containing protein [Astrocystis sublimbata]